MIFMKEKVAPGGWASLHAPGGCWFDSLIKDTCLGVGLQNCQGKGVEEGEQLNTSVRRGATVQGLGILVLFLVGKVHLAGR